MCCLPYAGTDVGVRRDSISGGGEEYKETNAKQVEAVSHYQTHGHSEQQE